MDNNNHISIVSLKSSERLFTLPLHNLDRSINWSYNTILKKTKININFISNIEKNRYKFLF